MNEQLIKFIELCLVDGVISDKEREVIFRKSKELGVPGDECEIILEGMIYKYNKENSISPKPNIEEKIVDITNDKIVISNPSKSNVDKEFLKILFYSEKDKKLPLIEERLTELNNQGNKLLSELDKCELEFQNLFQRKRNLTDNSNSVVIESIDKQIYHNDQELIRLKKEMERLKRQQGNGIRDLENQKEKICNIYRDTNFKLFLLLFDKSTLLYQSPIFDRLLQETEIDNDKQILNLTKFYKFLVDKERNYGTRVKQCFNKIHEGSLLQKDVELLLVEKKSIISFSNSFHLMFDSLSNNRMGVYMKIYLELESMGMFNTHFENEVLKNLNHLGKQLNRLNNTLSQVSREISQTNNYLNLLNQHMYNVNLNLEKTNSKLDSLDYSLWDISNSIQEGNKNLERSVNLLEDVKSGVNMNNLLTGIQTYQMYKINKNTKGLRE